MARRRPITVYIDEVALEKLDKKAAALRRDRSEVARDILESSLNEAPLIDPQLEAILKPAIERMSAKLLEAHVQALSKEKNFLTEAMPARTTPHDDMVYAALQAIEASFSQGVAPTVDEIRQIVGSPYPSRQLTELGIASSTIRRSGKTHRGYSLKLQERVEELLGGGRAELCTHGAALLCSEQSCEGVWDCGENSYCASRRDAQKCTMSPMQARKSLATEHRATPP